MTRLAAAFLAGLVLGAVLRRPRPLPEPDAVQPADPYPLRLAGALRSDNLEQPWIRYTPAPSRN